MTATVLTTPKRAVQLSTGDVIRDPHGGLHRVTEWEPFPEMALCFRTDTGLDLHKEWNDVGEYDVVTPRPDDVTLARYREEAR